MNTKLDTYCKNNGLRSTPQRHWVLIALKNKMYPVDATLLWIHLKSNDYNISLSSVYSSLQVLVEAGLVIRTMSSSKKYVYQIKNQE